MIDVDERDGVTVVQMRHGKVNALDLEMLRELSRTFASLRSAEAVVLTGAGTAFSAGVDLRRLLDDEAYVSEFLPALSEAFLALFDFPRPLVAAVNGHAIAGGCILVQACDRRLMSAGTIGVTELLVGLPFPAAALEVLRDRVGAHTTDLVLTGRTLPAADALAVGLVDEVVAPDELLPTATARAHALASIPADTFALAKEQLHRPARRAIDRGREVDDPRVQAAWTSAPVRAAATAYLERLAQRRGSGTG